MTVLNAYQTLDIHAKIKYNFRYSWNLGDLDVLIVGLPHFVRRSPGGGASKWKKPYAA